MYTFSLRNEDGRYSLGKFVFGARVWIGGGRGGLSWTTDDAGV